VFWCALLFIERGEGTPCIALPPKMLVTSGPYRYLRNPIYMGQIVMLIGFALFFRSSGVLVLAVSWAAFVCGFVLIYEEPGLKKRFGEAYEDYCGRVPRWLPAMRRTAHERTA